MFVRRLSIVLASLMLTAALGLSGSVAQADTPVRAPQAPPIVPPPTPKKTTSSARTEAVSSAASYPPAVAELTYVPLAPCVIADSRKGTGGNKSKFGSSTTRTFTVTGTSGFTAQGGQSSGCGVPANAEAVALTAVVIGPSKAGALRIWPSTGAMPSVDYANYGKFTMSNTGTVALNGPSIKVKNYTSKTNLALRVSGYYLPRIAGLVGGGGQVYSGTGILSVTNPSPGRFEVTVDRDVTYCTPMVNPYNAGPGVYANAYAFANNKVSVFAWYLDGITHNEAPLTMYVYLTVEC